MAGTDGRKLRTLAKMDLLSSSSPKPYDDGGPFVEAAVLEEDGAPGLVCTTDAFLATGAFAFLGGAALVSESPKRRPPVVWTLPFIIGVVVVVDAVSIPAAGPSLGSVRGFGKPC